MSSLPQPLPVTNPDEINLDSHAVIEASAGTGKTYLIENLVVRLLTSGKVPSLDRILIVTFTEKATSELRTRIRSKLQEELASNPTPVLIEAIQAFDTASIYTIHGFCNRILRSYSFENQTLAQAELCDDNIIYSQVLRTLLKDTWPEKYKDAFTDLLILSGFLGSSRSSIDRWMKKIISCATRYVPETGDIFLPERSKNLIETYEIYKSNIDRSIQVLQKISLTIENSKTPSTLKKQFEKLNINGTKKKKFLKHIIEPLENLLTMVSPIPLKEVHSFLDRACQKVESFTELNESWNKNGEDYTDHLPELPEIIQEMENLAANNPGKLGDLFLSEAVSELQQKGHLYKESHALVSYNDMLRQIYISVQNRDSSLTEILQQKYTYGLVDEFQDTDMLQWHIFKRIFLEHKKNRLLIVGDPKQAIYGFRGADVNAYYKARKEIISEHKGSYYTLSTNWRSLPSLLSVFNSLFGNTDWFSDKELTYFKNSSPENLTEVQEHLKPFQELTPTVTVVQLGEVSNTEAKNEFARFCANEITDLLNKHKEIEPGDIAVLVRNRGEIQVLEESFQEKGIPYSFYKKDGLYQSEAATHINALLKALAHRENRETANEALLTSFFSLSPSIHNQDSLSSIQESSLDLLHKWQSLALEKNWGILFQSLIKDSAIFTKLSENRLDQHWFNDYRQILQDLQIQAYLMHSTIDALARYCTMRRENPLYESGSGNIHAMEQENNSVQIMTIHASKGLEFKFLFQAGGFTSSRGDEVLRFHNKGKRYFALSGEKKHKDFHNLEQDLEMKRLFYVSLTRASCRLYLPIYTPGKRAKATSGFIANSLTPAIEKLAGIPGLEITSSERDNSQRYILKDTSSNNTNIPHALLINLPKKEALFSDRRKSLFSFSSLNHMHISTKTNPELPFSESEHHIVEDEQVLRTNSILNSSLLLPPGKETGTMLHEVLEDIIFTKIGIMKTSTDLLKKNSHEEQVISNKIHAFFPFIDGETFEKYRVEIADIVHKALSIPLPTISVSLKTIDTLWKEMEFYVKSNLLPVAIPGTTLSEGFLQGFIDLIFKHNNKYYILDWKSNTLESGYSPEQLETNMKEAGYDLQYCLYLWALHLWLEKTVPDYSYETHIGGVFYIYLRGINYNNSHDGIYNTCPEKSVLISHLSGVVENI